MSGGGGEEVGGPLFKKEAECPWPLLKHDEGGEELSGQHEDWPEGGIYCARLGHHKAGPLEGDLLKR